MNWKATSPKLPSFRCCVICFFKNPVCLSHRLFTHCCWWENIPCNISAQKKNKWKAKLWVLKQKLSTQLQCWLLMSIEVLIAYVYRCLCDLRSLILWEWKSEIFGSSYKIHAAEFQSISIKVFEIDVFQKAHLSSWKRRDGSWTSFCHRVNADS